MHLIDEDFLKSVADIDTQFNAERLAVYLNLVHEFYLTDLIGIDLLNLYTEHVANVTPLNAKQLQLFHFIKLYIAFRTHYELLPSLNAKTVSKGLISPDGAVSDKLLEMQRTHLYNRYTKAKEKIQDYLKVHAIDFPQYYAEQISTDIKQVRSNIGISFRQMPKIDFY